MKRLIVQAFFKAKGDITPRATTNQLLYDKCIADAKAYAERIGADHIVHGEQRYFPDFPVVFEKLCVFADPKFQEYDQVLVLDCDLIINPEADNIFDEFAHEYIAGCQIPVHISKIRKLRASMDIGEGVTILNGGVMLYTKKMMEEGSRIIHEVLQFAKERLEHRPHMFHEEPVTALLAEKICGDQQLIDGGKWNHQLRSAGHEGHRGKVNIYHLAGPLKEDKYYWYTGEGIKQEEFTR